MSNDSGPRTALTVRRVEDATGDHIEPPLGEDWSMLDKLRWQAGVTALDTGAPVYVTDLGGGSRRRFGVAWQAAGRGASTSGMTFQDAWTYLNGMSAGASAALANRAEGGDR